jgi:hypothetical protein
VSFPVKVKIKANGKVKVKGDGQECPSHTSKTNVKGSGRGRPLYALRGGHGILFKSDRSLC